MRSTFSASVIWSKTSWARDWGDSSAFNQGRANARCDGTEAVAAAGTVSAASPRTASPAVRRVAVLRRGGFMSARFHRGTSQEATPDSGPQEGNLPGYRQIGHE